MEPELPKEGKGHPKHKGRLDKETNTFEEVMEISNKEPKTSTTTKNSRALSLQTDFQGLESDSPFHVVTAAKEVQWKTIEGNCILLHEIGMV